MICHWNITIKKFESQSRVLDCVVLVINLPDTIAVDNTTSKSGVKAFENSVKKKK